MNYEAVINTLNERLRFIEEVQEGVLGMGEKDRLEICKKLNILKRPFVGRNSGDLRENFNEMVKNL